MAHEQMLNGIDLATMREAIDKVRTDPNLGVTQFRADNEWLEGTHCRAHIKGFYTLGSEDTSRRDTFSFDEDEPPAICGHNHGPNPTEYALVALSGCLTTTLAVYASAKGYKLDSVTSHYEGDMDLRGFFGLDESIRRGYSNIHVSFDIQGELTEAQKHELIELAQKYSPVLDIVTH